MIKAVLFDLDGTLYDRDALVSTLGKEQYAMFKADLQGLSSETFLAEFLEMDDHGYGKKQSGYRRLAVGWGLGPEVAARLLEDFWSRYDSLCVLPDDSARTLRELRAGGTRLGIITNGNPVRQRRKLASLDLWPLVDTVLISDEEGVAKPAVEIFHRALRRCAVDAHEAVFVGDHPEVDIEGAKGAGLLPIWKYVPYWSLHTNDVITIHKLSEILPICLDHRRGSPSREEPDGFAAP